MGIALVYTTATDATIERILADPPLVHRFIDDADDSETWADGERVQGDLDKSWHGIHYLLTGHADIDPGPTGYLYYGGEEVKGEEVGWAPPFVVRSGELRRFHEALSALDDATLRGRYDPAEMDRLLVNPSIWDDGDEALDYLMDFLGDLRKDLATAVDKTMGWVITYL